MALITFILHKIATHRSHVDSVELLSLRASSRMQRRTIDLEPPKNHILVPSSSQNGIKESYRHSVPIYTSARSTSNISHQRINKANNLRTNIQKKETKIMNETLSNRMDLNVDHMTTNDSTKSYDIYQSNIKINPQRNFLRTRLPLSPQLSDSKNTSNQDATKPRYEFHKKIYLKDRIVLDNSSISPPNDPIPKNETVMHPENTIVSIHNISIENFNQSVGFRTDRSISITYHNQSVNMGAHHTNSNTSAEHGQGLQDVLDVHENSSNRKENASVMDATIAASVKSPASTAFPPSQDLTKSLDHASSVSNQSIHSSPSDANASMTAHLSPAVVTVTETSNHTVDLQSPHQGPSAVSDHSESTGNVTDLSTDHSILIGNVTPSVGTDHSTLNISTRQNEHMLDEDKHPGSLKQPDSASNHSLASVVASLITTPQSTQSATTVASAVNITLDIQELGTFSKCINGNILHFDIAYRTYVRFIKMMK